MEFIVQRGLKLLVMMLLFCGPCSADRQAEKQKNKLRATTLQTVPYFNMTVIHQVKIQLELGEINEEFFLKINGLVSKLALLNSPYFNKSIISIKTAAYTIETFRLLLVNVTDQYQQGDTVTLIPFNPLPTAFLSSQTYPILSSIKSAKAIVDDANTKKLTDEIELQLTQMQQLILGQVALYNSIVVGTLPYTQLPNIVNNHVNMSGYDIVASKFISCGLFQDDFFVYYSLYLFSQETLIPKLSIAPVGKYSLEHPIFYQNGAGYIFTSDLPRSLATAVEVYSANEVHRILSDSPEQLSDLLFPLDQEKTMPEPFFYNQKGSVVFNNENSKTQYDFGPLEKYSPIISSFADKIIKIGQNTLKFVLQLNAKENNVVNFETDDFILQHLANIFNFELEYLFLLLILPVLFVLALIITGAYKIHQKIKLRKERKKREKNDYRNINMIFRKRPTN